MQGGITRAAATLFALTLMACASTPDSGVPSASGWRSAVGLDPRDRNAYGDHLFRARTSTDAALVGPMSFSVDTALPLVQTRTSTLLASRLSLGDDSSPLRYSASYALDPGELFYADQVRELDAPDEVGGQRIQQNVELTLPAVAGAPVSLGLMHQTSDTWTLDGETQEQSQVADLSWSPSIGTVKVQWAGEGSGRDSLLALDCGFRSQVDLPVPTRKTGRNRALRFTGRDCAVLSSEQRYADLMAQTYSLAYVWGQARRETRVRLAAIDPIWYEKTNEQDIEPSFEVGLSQARTRGAWTAEAAVSLRRTTALPQLISEDDPRLGYHTDVDTHLTTSARLTRRLPAFSVSASWTRGSDPLWFMPDVGEKADRFGLSLDFTRWMREMAPTLTPSLAMSWKWSESHSRSSGLAAYGENTVNLKMSVLW